MGCTREKIPEKRLCLVRCIRSKSCPFWEELEWDALSSPVSLPPSYSFDAKHLELPMPMYNYSCFIPGRKTQTDCGDSGRASILERQKQQVHDD